MKASVIVCTRNPKPEGLARLWAALAGQTGADGRWELVVVDNGSEPPVTVQGLGSVEVRVVREDTVGLTAARLRGIRESTGDVLIFFDDDNEPGSGYVAAALALFEARERLGAAGGVIEGKFETPPPAWARPYLGWLAVRPVLKKEQLIEPGSPWGLLPFGAGLCLRAEPAREYLEAVEADAKRRAFDRRGAVLTGSGDTDMVLTAMDLGYQALLSPRLRLRHYLPASRFKPDYLERLLEGSAYSTRRLERMRGVAGKPPWMNCLLRRIKRMAVTPPSCWPMVWRLEQALDRGVRKEMSRTS
jgi:glycosyltransferase involved in cell wall biosynthesis